MWICSRPTALQQLYSSPRHLFRVVTNLFSNFLLQSWKSTRLNGFLVHAWTSWRETSQTTKRLWTNWVLNTTICDKYCATSVTNAKLLVRIVIDTLPTGWKFCNIKIVFSFKTRCVLRELAVDILEIRRSASNSWCIYKTFSKLTNSFHWNF